SRLESHSQRLSAALDAAKQGWPPAMHHFEGLSARIRELEHSAHRRELEIARLLSVRPRHTSDASDERIQALTAEIEQLRGTVCSKDREIQVFRDELDRLLEGIRILK
ncbi:hypothetical protein BC831DRAFT_387349, partial [Entophlyctis helioformis]